MKFSPDIIFFDASEGNHNLKMGPIIPAHLLTETERSLIEHTDHYFTTDLKDRSGSHYKKINNKIWGKLTRERTIPDGTLFPPNEKESLIIGDYSFGHIEGESIDSLTEEEWEDIIADILKFAFIVGLIVGGIWLFVFYVTEQKYAESKEEINNVVNELVAKANAFSDAVEL